MHRCGLKRSMPCVDLISLDKAANQECFVFEASTMLEERCQCQSPLGSDSDNQSQCKRQRRNFCDDEAEYSNCSPATAALAASDLIEASSLDANIDALSLSFVPLYNKAESPFKNLKTNLPYHQFQQMLPSTSCSIDVANHLASLRTSYSSAA